MTDATQFQVYLFGAFSLYRWGERMPLPPSSDARKLLAYVLFHHHKPHMRDSLIGHFWPDMPEEQARRALTRALGPIRHALADLVSIESGCVGVHPQASIWVDVSAFKQLTALWLRGAELNVTEAALSDLHTAARLYQGDLLEGYYDEWIVPERECLFETHLQALERLAQTERAAGHYAQALELGLRLIRLDALRESAQREVMRLYHLLKRPEAALKQFAAYRQTLHDELAIEPEAATLKLAHEISRRAGQEDNVYLPNVQAETFLEHAILDKAHPTPFPLIGRRTERAELLWLAERMLEDGAGGIVLVEGEAGVGKSRLLKEIAQDAGWRGAQSLWGVCKRGEMTSPYEPLTEAIGAGLSLLRVSQLGKLVEPVWLQALKPLLPPLAAAWPDSTRLESLEGNEERSRLVEAWACFLTGWGQITPVTLILEDLHWADPDTLDLLCNLAQRLSSAYVLIVGSYRPEEARTQPQVWEKIQALDRVGLRGRVVLGCLDQTASSEFTRHYLGMGHPAPAFEQRLYHETSGNPLFMLETLRYLYDEGLLARDAEGNWQTPYDDTTADYVELPIPPAMEEAIARRLTLLPVEAQKALNGAAILGHQVDFEALCATSELPPERLLVAINHLKRKRLLEETGQAYTFTHDKVRQVVYNRLPQAGRVHLHAHAAHVLQAMQPEAVEQLAYHCSEGELWRPAVEYNYRAGQHAQSAQAHQSALDYYARALAILSKQIFPDAQWAVGLQVDVLAARGGLLWQRGDVAQLKADVNRLTALSEAIEDVARQAQVLNQQAFFLLNVQDQYKAAWQYAQTALDIARRHGLAREEAIALENMGLAYNFSGQYEAGEEALRRSLAIWEKIEPRSFHAAQIHYHLARTYALDRGMLAQAEPECKIVLEMAEDEGKTLLLSQALLIMENIANRRGDYHTALSYAQAGLEHARALGHRQHEASHLGNMSVAYQNMRDFGNAIACLQRCLELARTASHKRNMISALCNMAAIYIDAGRRAAAQPLIHEAAALVQETHNLFLEGWVLQALGQIYLDDGNLAEAEKVFRRCSELGETIHIPDFKGIGLFGLGQIGLRTDQPAQAVRYLQQAYDAFQPVTANEVLTYCRSYEAMGHLAMGDLEEAISTSKRAVAEAESRPGCQYTQVVFLHHGRILRAAGQAELAWRAIEAAHQTVLDQQRTLPAGWQADFLQSPVNREVLATYAEMQSEDNDNQTLTVRLPRAGVPLGRPLRDDEWTTVSLTLLSPDDDPNLGKAALRQFRLLRMLKEAGQQGAAPTMRDLAQLLRVTTKTIQRDLAALRAAGHVVETRGG